MLGLRLGGCARAGSFRSYCVDAPQLCDVASGLMCVRYGRGGLPSRAYGDDGNLIANPTFTNQASGSSTTSPRKRIGEASHLDLPTKLLNGQRNLKQANGNHFALAWNLKPQDTDAYFEPGSTYTTFSTQSGSTYEWASTIAPQPNMTC